MSGRDFGQDLQNKTTWAYDQNTVANSLYNLMTFGTSPALNLPAAPNPGSSSTYPYTEITYTKPSSPSDPANTTNVDLRSRGGSYLSDTLKCTLALVNWDMYVDLAKNLQAFPACSIDSGINLFDLDNDARNNILGPVHFQPGGWHVA